MTTFRVAEGVHGIDIDLFDAGVGAVYLLDDAEPTLLDGGTAAGADRILAGLRECGVDPADLDHLVLSHVHADHSGAASALVGANPDLTVHIHELTAPHLVDPGELIESSKRAMGEDFAAMGEQGPVPEGNVAPVPEEGTTLDVGANALELVPAPGHSPDHLAVWNPERGLLFAAEALGIYLERADRWLPPSSLPNFDPDVLEDSIDRLAALAPEEILFPHFGAWPRDPADAFDTARRELRRFEDRILAVHEGTDSRAETKARVADELVDVSPPYNELTERFYASLITDGYLRHHGIE